MFVIFPLAHLEGYSKNNFSHYYVSKVGNFSNQAIQTGTPYSVLNSVSQCFLVIVSNGLMVSCHGRITVHALSDKIERSLLHCNV
jgi:hypothetical protein